MKKSFTIPRTETTTEDIPALQAEIVKSIGSEAEAASIVRGVLRIGSDPSILFYEVTLVSRASRYGGVATPAWRVRADRGRPPVVEPAPLEN